MLTMRVSVPCGKIDPTNYPGIACKQTKHAAGYSTYLCFTQVLC